MNLSTCVSMRRGLLCATGLACLVILFSTTPLAAQATTQPATGSTRQPTIIKNQFNTVSTGSIGARSPGKMVEQGLAEATGNLTLSGNGETDTPTWFKTTFDQIAQSMLTMFSGVLTGINTFIQSLGPLMATGSTSPSTTTFVVPPNGSTTWSGTSQTIP